MVSLCAFFLGALPWLCSNGQALQGPTEAEIQARICAGMAREVVLAQMGRADCISETHAIEIDWTENWHEGVGQALAYAAATGLEPGLVLICRKSAALCLKHSLGAQETLGSLVIRATIWECVPEDVTLADCRRLDIGP